MCPSPSVPAQSRCPQLWTVTAGAGGDGSVLLWCLLQGAAPALVPGETGICTVHEMCPSLEGLHCSAVPALASEHPPRGHGSPPSSSRALTPEPWPQLKPAVPDNNQGSGEMKAGRSRTPQQYLCHPPSIQADARTAPSRTGTDTTLCLIPACHCSCLKDIPKTLT